MGVYLGFEIEIFWEYEWLGSCLLNSERNGC